MPTYDYECEACDHSFELFQGINDPVKRKCPVCGRMKLRRLIGAGAGLVFKGSGFYITDYRHESYKKAAEAEKKSGSEKSESKGKKDSNKSDSKAKKKESKTKTK